MFGIPTSIIKKIPYIGPAVAGLGIFFDVKDIVEITTPVGATRIVAERLVNECTPPELLIAGKCVMLVGGVIATVATGGNPLVISGTLSAARSIVKN
jgi:hypothetical protein